MIEHMKDQDLLSVADKISSEKITLESKEYTDLLKNGEILSTLKDRKKYFHTIFLEALKNSL